MNIWINVSERLPDKGELVDIWLMTGKRITDARYEGNGYFRKGCVWYSPDKAHSWIKPKLPILDITHQRN
jgi:hypothetical protein